jgi:hypothetical protein
LRVFCLTKRGLNGVAQTLFFVVSDDLGNLGVQLRFLRTKKNRPKAAMDEKKPPEGGL